MSDIPVNHLDGISVAYTSDECRTFRRSCLNVSSALGSSGSSSPEQTSAVHLQFAAGLDIEKRVDSSVVFYMLRCGMGWW